MKKKNIPIHLNQISIASHLLYLDHCYGLQMMMMI